MINSLIALIETYGLPDQAQCFQLVLHIFDGPQWQLGRQERSEKARTCCNLFEAPCPYQSRGHDPVGQFQSYMAIWRRAVRDELKDFLTLKANQCMTTSASHGRSYQDGDPGCRCEFIE
jgi:hypothetical protein